MKTNISLKAALAATLLFVFSPAAITANEEPDEDRFVPLSELRPLEKAEGYRNKHSFLYGISASNTYINKKENWVQANKTDYAMDQRKGMFLGNYRPYFKYLYNEQHIINVRGRFEYRNNPSLPDDPKLRQGEVVSTGTYSVELLNAELDFDQHTITAGRSFYRMGRGLLFANFADGAEYTGNFRFLRVKALAAYSGDYGGCTISLSGCRTNPDAETKSVKARAAFDIIPGRPIDTNVPDPGRRYFLGTEIQSPHLYGSNAYLLGLYSRDASRDASTAQGNAGRLFAFDPLYIGAGFQGYIVTPRLRYLTEAIYQTGKTYNKNTTSDASKNEQVTINAWAVTADLNYSLPYAEHLIKPGLSLQYAYATGRDSSNPNPANPAQENTGSIDNNFYSFGVYSAGLAFQPRLSNLHIIRLGFQLRPLHQFYWGRNFMLSAKYTLYFKGNTKYGISDNKATEEKSSVGSAIDIQSVWDLRSDLKLFYAYGYFSPGAAFKEADSKTAHSHIVSLNLLF